MASYLQCGRLRGHVALGYRETARERIPSTRVQDHDRSVPAYLEAANLGGSTRQMPKVTGSRERSQRRTVEIVKRHLTARR